MFGRMLSAIQASQQLKLGGRQQTLAERKFESSEIDTQAKRRSVENIRSLTSGTLYKASAADLVLLNGNISTMLSMDERDRQGKPVDGKNAPREVKLLAAARQEIADAAAQGQTLAIEDTQIVQMMQISSVREMSDTKIRDGIVAEQNKATFGRFAKLSKAEQKEIVDTQLEIIKDVVNPTPLPSTGNPILDEVFEELETAKRTKAMETIKGIQ